MVDDFGCRVWTGFPDYRAPYNPLRFLCLEVVVDGDVDCSTYYPMPFGNPTISGVCGRLIGRKGHVGVSRCFGGWGLPDDFVVSEEVCSLAHWVGG